MPYGVPVLPGLDDVAPQTLAFDLSITEDVQMAGAVTARLTFSCNEIDSYVIARLSRIDADGNSHLLSMGALRPATRTEATTRGSAIEIAIDGDRREPLVPGEPVVLRFSLTPGPVLLRAGEMLRLDLGSRALRGQELDRGHGRARRHAVGNFPDTLDRMTPRSRAGTASRERSRTCR